MMNDEKGSVKDQRKSYTCSFKLKVVEYAELYSNSRAAEEYGVHRRRVQEWKNQKSRLVEQVQNFNGGTKRLKGGGRRKVEVSKDKNVDFEKMLGEHILTLVTEGGITLDKSLIVQEAKVIDSSFNVTNRWVDQFILKLEHRIQDNDEDLLPPPSSHHHQSSGRRKNKHDSSSSMNNTIRVSAELGEQEMDHYFDLVAKDEMRVVRHLENKLYDFIGRSSDRIMLSELVYREAKKHSHIFEVSLVWVSEFLDLHKGFINDNSQRCRRASTPLALEMVDEYRRATFSPPILFKEPYDKQPDSDDPEQNGIRSDMFLSKDGEYFFHGDPVKRKRIFDALRLKPISIYEWMDECLEEYELFCKD